MRFKTELSGRQLYYSGINEHLGIPSDYDVDYNHKKVVIDWGVEIESRDWGIKSISTTVYSITVEIDLMIQDDCLSKNDITLLQDKGFESGVVGLEKNISFTINDNWEIDTEELKEIKGSLFISECNIYFENNLIQLV